MPEASPRVYRIGERCPTCPSKMLGPLALGQTCRGPKFARLGGNDTIDYCGREAPPVPQKTVAQQIYEQISKNTFDD